MSAAAGGPEEAKENVALKEKKSKGAGRFESGDDAALSNLKKGELKDFSQPMAAEYFPKQVEAGWDAYWEAQGLYLADAQSDKKKVVMVIPPPNVTGTLHLGHALTVAIEDAIIRWHRMSGREVLWVPGTDHAGIATQVVVEKKLMRERKLTRHDLGREKFLEEVWHWKNLNGDRICNQLRRLATSVDWSRLRFTMDEMCSKAVVEAFYRMHQKGLIYRANRLVSWSCALRTAISAIEVEKLELDAPTLLRVPGYDQKVEFGVIHSFSYKFADFPGEEIVVATTRLETMLGDVAVAVHPDDARYKKYHGARVIHPFLPDRHMTVICDGELVDPEFGTGCVKITPAHDPNDFLCGQRHNLPMINIFDDSGLINQHGGPYAGMKRFDARVKIVEDLTKLGAYKGKSPNKMVLGICSRSKDIVEPVLRPQWWVDCKDMAANARKAVEVGDLNILPENHVKTWNTWLGDIQDWCISRQLWWGHRIPAWFIKIKGQAERASHDHEAWIVARSAEEAQRLAVAKYPGVPAEDISLHQDEDVLDTWFSSGLFPFSVMGWPESTPDLSAFYPNQLLETGHDILFFWVARMVMMGQTLTGQLPFKTVYLHAMVRDKIGRKMSKSLGNVVDPIDVMDGITLERLEAKLRDGNLPEAEVALATENQRKDFPEGIAECGADALRLGLLAYTTQGRDINLDILRVVSYRQFCNKLWNAARFALGTIPADFKRPAPDAPLVEPKNFATRWILSRLNTCVEAMDKSFTSYEFGAGVSAIHSFWLYDLCDNFLEMIKVIFRSGKKEDATPEQRENLAHTATVLFVCIDMGLRLLHPYMPFVTEELYHRLPDQPVRGQSKECGSIMVAPYPHPSATVVWANEEVEAQMAIIKDVVHSARSVTIRLNVPSRGVNFEFVSSDNKTVAALQAGEEAITSLVPCAGAKVSQASAEQAGARRVGYIQKLVLPDLHLFLPLQGLVDLGAEVVKSEKSLKKMEGLVDGLKQKMSGPVYLEKTPPETQLEQKERLAAYITDCEALRQNITDFLQLMDPQQRRGYYEKKVVALKEALDKSQKQRAKVTSNLVAGQPVSKKNQQIMDEKDAEMAVLQKELAEAQAALQE